MANTAGRATATTLLIPLRRGWAVWCRILFAAARRFAIISDPAAAPVVHPRRPLDPGRRARRPAAGPHLPVLREQLRLVDGRVRRRVRPGRPLAHAHGLGRRARLSGPLSQRRLPGLERRPRQRRAALLQRLPRLDHHRGVPGARGERPPRPIRRPRAAPSTTPPSTPPTAPCSPRSARGSDPGGDPAGVARVAGGTRPPDAITSITVICPLRPDLDPADGPRPAQRAPGRRAQPRSPPAVAPTSPASRSSTSCAPTPPTARRPGAGAVGRRRRRCRQLPARARCPAPAPPWPRCWPCAPARRPPPDAPDFTAAAVDYLLARRAAGRSAVRQLTGPNGRRGPPGRRTPPPPQATSSWPTRTTTPFNDARPSSTPSGPRTRPPPGATREPRQGRSPTHRIPTRRVPEHPDTDRPGEVGPVQGPTAHGGAAQPQPGLVGQANQPVPRLPRPGRPAGQRAAPLRQRPRLLPVRRSRRRRPPADACWPSWPRRSPPPPNGWCRRS